MYECDDSCQAIFQEGIARDFSEGELDWIMIEYTPEELRYALPGYPTEMTMVKNLEGENTEGRGKRHDDVHLESINRVLLNQQFHAGIVELGRSKRWKESGERVLGMD